MRKIALVFVIFLLVISQLAYGISVKKENSILDKTRHISELCSDLPEYFNWRDINGVDFTTPIRTQQPYASCETFAFVAALETMVQWEVGYPFGCDLSEAHLYFWSGGNRDWGSFPENDTNFLVEYGIPDEACWPYPNHLKEPIVFPKNTTCDNWQERTVKIKNWSYLPQNNITAIKKAVVNNGPVPTHLHVYKDFQLYRGGIYRHTYGKSLGLHLVCIVGYKDDPSIPSGGYWIVKNSWGIDLPNGDVWGEDGWIRVAYGEASIEEMPVLFEGVYGQFPILYVDDDNTGGPWDGSKINPFKTISKAIDEAYEGWTIYVKNGTYNENIVIDKTINLDGENKENTIINGNFNGNVVYVQAPEVRISGLTIKNSGKKRLDSGIRTLSLDSNLTIKDCIIKDNDVGIYLNCMDFDTYPKSYNIIKNNTIKENNVGIFSMWVHNNEIVNNNISNNYLHGIEMESTKYSNIKNNLITNNKKHGIYLHGSSDENNIVLNNFNKNDIGIKLKEVKKTKINNNNFIENDIHATFDQSIFNNWNKNYWEGWQKILPYPIKGTITNYGILFYNFDWFPVKNPN